MLFVNDCPDFKIPLNVAKNGIQNGLEMSVYPNPSSGAFTLETKDAKGRYNMNVYDLMGRMIESRQVDFAAEPSVKFEIKCKGLYIVTLTNGDNRLTKKVVEE